MSYHCHVFLQPYHHYYWCQRVSDNSCGSNMRIHTFHSGVGCGICQRLLLSFCGEPLPQDALPQPLATPGTPLPCEFIPNSKVTLILACRNPKKATSARDQLLKFVDEHIARRTKRVSPEQAAHMKAFRSNLSLDLLQLDLASSSSTLDFCEEVKGRYATIALRRFVSN